MILADSILLSKKDAKRATMPFPIPSEIFDYYDSKLGTRNLLYDNKEEFIITENLQTPIQIEFEVSYLLLGDRPLPYTKRHEKSVSTIKLEILSPAQMNELRRIENKSNLQRYLGLIIIMSSVIMGVLGVKGKGNPKKGKALSISLIIAIIGIIIFALG